MELTFLVANPYLQGDYFQESVILVLEHDEKGALGLIVNQESTARIADVVEGGTSNDPVLLGGPVDQKFGWCIYRYPTGMEGEIKLGGTTCVSTSYLILQHLMQSVGSEYHLIMGYSGWGTGQLEKECQEGTWLWVHMDDSLIFDTPVEERWSKAIASLGIVPAQIMPGGAKA
ncbi:YqgE/AlgH family protein [Deinococcus cellulosilyticus]|uniref:DUF179 domain-containing protein n=1 Tax=Deinococcus cellulosilyticus (strain DSM 18568 / NBRC 106333 / KACC 11606 / 5516J-15) TaxID=1223518 RepID=A0A511N2P6_DEIC1|nr:YqgE/AlgH family protein [Deinococcus cellulosilyticus]GEM47125.1 DUF179 domain-containing protein [Deinococcus cellulosilyticus NBRC 106333 = KACC 11606]